MKRRLERLARREEKAIVKRIVYLSVFSVILIIILYTVGIPTLGKFADLLDTVFKRGDSTGSVESQIPPPPVLDTLPHATNNSKITVSGFSSSSVKAELYLDLEKVSEVQVNDGKFRGDLELKQGENKIVAKAVSEAGKTSDASQEFTIIFDNKEPELEVTAPSNDQTFYQNNRVKVSGKTEKDNQVFANGFLANVDPDGNFEVTIPLVEGENKIEVKAVDIAGNTKMVEIKVNFRK